LAESPRQGAVYGLDVTAKPWELRLLDRQAKIALYLAQPDLLKAPGDPKDRALGLKVEQFVKAMLAPPVSQHAAQV
jgi:hypothetical protein